MSAFYDELRKTRDELRARGLPATSIGSIMAMSAASHRAAALVDPMYRETPPCVFCGHREHPGDICEQDLGEHGECQCVDDRSRPCGVCGATDLAELHAGHQTISVCANCGSDEP